MGHNLDRSHSNLHTLMFRKALGGESMRWPHRARTLSGQRISNLTTAVAGQGPTELTAQSIHSLSCAVVMVEEAIRHNRMLAICTKADPKQLTQQPGNTSIQTEYFMRVMYKPIPCSCRHKTIRTSVQRRAKTWQ